MAFAAVTSALLALNGLADSPRILISSSIQETLLSEYNQAQWKLLLSTLSSCSEVVSASDERIIIQEARRLQDAIEFAVSSQFLEQSENCKPTFYLNLNHLKKDMDRFATVAEKMRRRIEELWEEKVAKMIEEDVVEVCVPRKEEDEEEEEDVSASVTDMVGLNDEFHRLRDAIARLPCPRTTLKYSLSSIVFWISGMAGVGKTAFVERIYQDSLVKATFECWAFVRVGREYRVERVLRAITAQLNRGDEKMLKDRSLCTTLGAKRCLIVLDDVWDRQIIEHLVERNEKIECWGSLILLTSRMEPYTPYHQLCMKIRFLNEEESWELLRRKVFGEEVMCPPLLVKAGKKIAKKCGGLPLLINAVAPILLSEADHDPEIWKRIAERPNSVMEEASNRISEVLVSSYNDLNEVYKLLFLYISAFPQSDEVFCSTIMKLWYAEGFLNLLPEYIWDIDKSNAFRELLEKNLVITDDHQRN